MILVADSGSTKTDWAILSNKPTCFTKTSGFNPMFHNTEFIAKHINKNKDLASISKHITQIYYYGAGCSSSDRINIISSALKVNFPHANLTITHDIEGAAKASCGKQAGISCILGTGSNCVYFDGQKTFHYTKSLGYILGDEGSGAYLGKKIVADFINKKLPPVISNHLKKEYKLNIDGVFKAVYNSEHPMQYLANFSKALSSFKEEEYTQELLYLSFNSFINTHVLAIPKAKQNPIHFVGSIALHFKKELQNALKKNELSIGNIIQKPIEPLAHYHKNEI